MKNNGKELERIVHLIEETLKDSPNTIIYKRYKIPNSGGRNREFDVFIESKLNGFNINIAIECKDFKKSIPAEKIEAFETKCNRVKSISKKVFISSNGFQPEAINVARDCGIELQIASKVSAASILDWFPITELEIKHLPGGHAQVFLDVEEDVLKQITNPIEGQFKHHGNVSDLNRFLVNFYYTNRIVLNQLAVECWTKLPVSKQKDQFTFPFDFIPEHLFYLNGDKPPIKVTRIAAKFQMHFEHIPAQLQGSIALKVLNGEVKADTLSFQFGNELKGSLVRTADKKTTLYIEGNNTDLTHFRLITNQKANS
jgi:hypothetical protein